MREKVNIVWFKRDLRLSDHQPLKYAFDSALPTLLIYNFEPLLLDDAHYNERHWRFVYQSLIEMNKQLARFNARVYLFSNPMDELLDSLNKQFEIASLLSHQEIGLNNTFERDKAVKKWCKHHAINWLEFSTGGVIRGAKNRKGWNEHWHQYMHSPIAIPNWKNVNTVTLNDYQAPSLPDTYTEQNPHFQIGGALKAQQVMQSFFESRGKGYQKGISSPSLSQTHCSRLSPYLAWGNISLRQVYQKAIDAYDSNHPDKRGWKRPLAAFVSRLHWHCHFMQKFESECSMEFKALNAGYHQFPYRDDDKVAEDIQRWAQGRFYREV